MKQQAIVRLVVLVLVLVNQTLVVFGANPLPYSEEQLFEGVSSAATVLVGLWAWHKNNNVSKEAQEAQKVLDELKGKK